MFHISKEIYKKYDNPSSSFDYFYRTFKATIHTFELVWTKIQTIKSAIMENNRIKKYFKQIFIL